uniref:Interferon-related developmental regulator N-terminal domain-containing protein n=1 Tax=Anopheles maculatus TaxID=74869 RepID=A0A182SDU2_9DIPT
MASEEVQLEETLRKAIDDTSDNRQQTRINAYELICEILMHNYIPDSLANRKMTLLSSLERSMRKGREKEQIIATKTIPLLMVQSETTQDVSEEFVKMLKPTLISITYDFKNANCSKLSTISNKFQAKEDLKQQRLIFRDVLHYLREGVTPDIRIKFEDETLLLDSWTIHHQYACLRNVLASGMNVHLKENLLIRDILTLGPKVSKLEKRFEKILKLEQRASNEVASKNRSIARGKERDKRFASLE